MKNNTSVKEIIGLSIIVLAFILSAYISNQYSSELGEIIKGYEVFGAFIYTLLAITSTVLAPFNTMFLIPLAATLWGPLITAILSILGWTVGSVIAYAVARRFGRPIVRRFINLDKVDKVSGIIPKENIFIWLVLARMTVPVDVLSYAIGLLAPIPYGTYTLATFMGVAPFAFIFSYASTLPPIYIAISTLIAFVAVALGYRWVQAALRKSSNPSDRQVGNL